MWRCALCREDSATDLVAVRRPALVFLDPFGPPLFFAYNIVSHPLCRCSRVSLFISNLLAWHGVRCIVLPGNSVELSFDLTKHRPGPSWAQACGRASRVGSDLQLLSTSISRFQLAVSLLSTLRTKSFTSICRVSVSQSSTCRSSSISSCCSVYLFSYSGQ